VPHNPFFQWEKSFFLKSGRSFEKSKKIYFREIHVVKYAVKISKRKIAKFEAGEFENRFFPRYFEILGNTASTKEREGLKTD
jgi:hypothetical protein